MEDRHSDSTPAVGQLFGLVFVSPYSGLPTVDTQLTYQRGPNRLWTASLAKLFPHLVAALNLLL